MSVGRICSRIVVTADCGESAAAAAQRMQNSNVGSLPVLDDEGRLVGVLTDRDLALRVVAARRNADTTAVAEVMSECVQSIHDDAAIEAALALMRSRKTRRLPVVDRAGKLVGLLTLDDVLSLLCEEFAAIGSLLDSEAPLAQSRYGQDETTADPKPLPLGTTRCLTHRDGATPAHRVQEAILGIRDALEAIACSLAIGLPTRSLGGGVTESDCRSTADRRLAAMRDRKADGAMARGG